MSSNVKNILRNIGFLISIPVIIGAFVFAVAEDKKSNVAAFEVDIINPEFAFVTVEEIKHSLAEENVILNHSAIEQLNVAALEEKINSNPWVEHAEVFVTSAQSVKVRLRQVNPKLRVQRTDSTSNGYYLDDKGFMIPLSRTYAPDLPILTSERRITTIGQRKELVKLAQFIEQDTFWRATIAQINLDRSNDIELISLIGDANIRFGSIDNMEDKFFRLFQFYKKGINRINWNNVKELDLRFDRQLVCRRYHKEQRIEETRTPNLYVKSKTEPVAPVANQIVVAKAKKREKKTTHAELPKKKTVALQEAPKENKVPKKIEKVKRVAVKKQSVVVAEKKVKPLAKKIVQKETVEKKPVIKAETKPAQPKVKKKKREIIINTEPVTLKKATQK